MTTTMHKLISLFSISKHRVLSSEKENLCSPPYDDINDSHNSEKKTKTSLPPNADLDLDKMGPMYPLVATSAANTLLSQEVLSMTWNNRIGVMKSAYESSIIFSDLLFDVIDFTKAFLTLNVVDVDSMDITNVVASDLISSIVTKVIREDGSHDIMETYKGFSLDHYGWLENRKVVVYKQNGFAKVYIPCPLMDGILYRASMTSKIEMIINTSVHTKLAQMTYPIMALDTPARIRMGWVSHYVAKTSWTLNSVHTDTNNCISIPISSIDGCNSMLSDVILSIQEIDCNEKQQLSLDKCVLYINNHVFGEYDGYLCKHVIPNELYKVQQLPDDLYVISFLKNPLDTNENQRWSGSINVARIENVTLVLYLKPGQYNVKTTFRNHNWLSYSWKNGNAVLYKTTRV